MLFPRGSGIRAIMLVLVLMVTGSVLEVYSDSDIPIGDGGSRLRPKEVDEDKVYTLKTASGDVENLLLWKISNSFKDQEDMPTDSSTDTIIPNTSDKNADVKKWVTLLKSNHSPAKTQKQPKWKIKKGTPMMCYFKLCSFKARIFTKSER